MLILVYSLIKIRVSNSPIGIGNLEPVNDGKRTLVEQNDNYIILKFKNEAKYFSKQLFSNYNRFISSIINENETIDLTLNKEFIVKSNTNLEVHFNKEIITTLINFLGGNPGIQYSDLISVDLSHFNTSSVSNMYYMFPKCYSLQTLDLSNFNTSSVI